MSTKQIIENMQDLCDCFYAEEPAMLNKRIYKGTDCGASISVLIAPEDPDEFGDLPSFEEPYWIHNGDRAWDTLTVACRLVSFTIQTIVEGSDATVDSEPFILPVKKSDVWHWVQFMEQEASSLWELANLACYSCETMPEEGEEFEDGLCKFCGQGE